MLEEKVLPWVQEVVGEQGVTLQQDGATSHTANSVQAWCRVDAISKVFGRKSFGRCLHQT